MRGGRWIKHLTTRLSTHLEPVPFYTPESNVQEFELLCFLSNTCLKKKISEGLTWWHSKLNCCLGCPHLTPKCWLLCFSSSFLLMHSGSQQMAALRRWAPCHPCGRSRCGSGLLAQAWLCGNWGESTRGWRISLLTLPFKVDDNEQ